MRAAARGQVTPAALTGRLLRHVDTARRPAALLGGLLLATNAVPGVALFFYLQFLDPGARGVPDPAHVRAVILRAFFAFLVVALPVGAVITARGMRPITGWLGAREPTTAEQRSVLQGPVRAALLSLAFWTVAAANFGALDAVLGYPGRRVALTVSAVLLSGAAASSLAALVAERVLRPVTARALAGDLPPGWRGIGVLPRVLLSWAFGSAVPLVGLLLAPVDQPDRTLSSFAVPLAVLCAAGLLSGFLIITGAARSVAEPLRSVRLALQRVEAGDLDVVVPVDDSGEVGQVQAGVNRMVLGLRQRRILEDLFGRYVGTAVADQALERGVDLSGERAEASVVFVDLLGSTAMAAALPPEDVVRTLNAYFAAVVGAAAGEGGWVNKFEGDGALCIFGPPAGEADHAARALRAAKAIAARVEDESRHHRALVAAIGVSSGPVVAGNIGSPERFEYTVIGDPVNEAARLTDLAKSRPGRLLASQAVVEGAAGQAGRWIPSGEVVLRGRPAPTRLWSPAPG